MALIPPFYTDCVVAIGVQDKSKKPQWVASGFFYGHYSEGEGDDKTYRIYLVTNRHVYQDKAGVIVRCNPQAEGPARDYELPLVDKDDRPVWYGHPNREIDVAVIAVNFGLLQKHGMQVHFFESDRHPARIQEMNELGITEGDFAYVLGFPMGLVGEERSTVIVRHGTIARIRDTLAGASQDFLVDAFVFPGNSGGPVVLKPEGTAITGTKSQGRARLIGIVKKYVPYRDVAVSLQTRLPRVIFEENSGLAAAHPIDFVEDAIAEHLKALAAQKADTIPTSASENPA
jgi:S1-C subfamily serine protease